MNSRQDKARAVRYSAADLAYHRTHPRHVSSGDEQRYRRNRVNSDGVLQNVPSLINTFTKGFTHDSHGFIENPDYFEEFIRASDGGDIDEISRLHLHAPGANPWQSAMANTAKAPAADPRATVRGWESMGTGQTFELEGYDPQALTIPPAPKLWSHELAAEMVELYWMALARDVPFSDFAASPIIDDAVKHLNKLKWFKSRQTDQLDEYEIKRKRGYFMTASGAAENHAFNDHNVFRANVKGDDIGFPISQFLYVGTNAQGTGHQTDGVSFDMLSGFIQYGSSRIDQRVRIATPGKDYMTNWDQWLDTQNAADLRGLETYGDLPGGNPSGFRFIYTPRDLATYVHYDALHQAYFNACLILLDLKIPFDAGIPFRDRDAIDKQIGFATFGGPHILNLVSEVATRALKAIRYQKYSVHRRARPEQVAGFIHQFKTDNSIDGIQCMEMLIDNMHAANLFNQVEAFNQAQNAAPDRSGDPSSALSSWLLPMPFAEGSPMHPSYGSGHATVAGACVTILKAFFDSGYVLPFAVKPTNLGQDLANDAANLNKYTVEGELNKLAANIAIGRNWGGVHWYSDQLESLRVGEKIALGILEEQKLTYGENFSMSVPLFDGTTIRI